MPSGRTGEVRMMRIPVRNRTDLKLAPRGSQGGVQRAWLSAVRRRAQSRYDILAGKKGGTGADVASTHAVEARTGPRAGFPGSAGFSTAIHESP